MLDLDADLALPQLRHAADELVACAGAHRHAPQQRLELLASLAAADRWRACGGPRRSSARCCSCSRARYIATSSRPASVSRVPPPWRPPAVRSTSGRSARLFIASSASQAALYDSGRAFAARVIEPCSAIASSSRMRRSPASEPAAVSRLKPAEQAERRCRRSPWCCIFNISELYNDGRPAGLRGRAPATSGIIAA